MSMMTTSASSLSAIARATVAPTLPAPPTTVTLRFMCYPCPSLSSDGRLHVGDHRVGELRGLQLGRVVHLARQIVGDLLLLNRLLEPLLDQVRGLRPAHVAEHHHAGEDDRARVDDVLARVLGRGAVGGLEEADLVADVGA